MTFLLNTHEETINFHFFCVFYLLFMLERGFGGVAGSGDRSLIRFGLNDINTPGRARIHLVCSRNTSLRLQG